MRNVITVLQFLKSTYLVVAGTVGTVVFILAFVAVPAAKEPVLLVPESVQFKDQFVGVSGKKAHESVVKNILIVHGIGTHCIGYGDQLITNSISAAS